VRGLSNGFRAWTVDDGLEQYCTVTVDGVKDSSLGDFPMDRGLGR